MELSPISIRCMQQQLNVIEEASLKIRQGLENIVNAYTNNNIITTERETLVSMLKPKHIAKDTNNKEILFKLKLNFEDDGQSPTNKEALLEHTAERLLNCDQVDISDERIEPPPEATDVNPVYDMNEQYANLLMIFPEADPVYLRNVAEEIYSDPEEITKFVQSKLENLDYPTIMEQQKQYTTDFKARQFLEIFPDPFLHFEDDERDCGFNTHAVDFLKFHFSKLKVNTLLKAYSEHTYNLSLTAKALEALNDHLKNERRYNKIYQTTKDIPFLQECAFIQHKAELRIYMDRIKTQEEQEFNELKARNELLECQCCYDNECMPSKCSACQDGHLFCNRCIVRGADIALRKGNTRIDCLLQCGCEFPIVVLQQVLLPTKFNLLLYNRRMAAITTELEGLILCPLCQFAFKPPLMSKIMCINSDCTQRISQMYVVRQLECAKKKTY